MAGKTITPEAIEFATRMYNAARAGQIDVFKQALPAGLPANLTNDQGDTLLMLAAYHGHAELVTLLIQHGADPNRLNDKGQSPISGAVFKKEDAVIQALLDGGADPEYGSPSAIQCIAMFKQEDKWGVIFETAPGKGKPSKT
ncbi:ankyrin repeat-containing domain protein [Xylaria venustula]|nr:ankyrin repeat-containing domain protein [Xylaria venustula]